MESKTKLSLTLICTCLLASCVTTTKVDLQSTFDEVQAKSMLEKGNNEIKGSALFRQRNGGVVTCAGRRVNLVPATEYATERMVSLYGTGSSGSSISRKNVTFLNTPVAYTQIIKTTTCDPQGHFKFKDISENTFYITTSITWETGKYGGLEGGNLMKRVVLKNNQEIDVVLTH